MAAHTELTVHWADDGHLWESEKHFVVMTNEPLRTDWSTESENEVVENILNRCKQDDIQINVIGIDDEIGIQLADLTGGRWYALSENERQGPPPREDLFMPFLPKIDMIFERIAQHIADTVKQPADIVFIFDSSIFDSSLSRDDKVEEICTGLDTLVRILDSEGLDYRFGVIRFWARTAKSSFTITRPPLNAEQVQKLFRRLNRGDAYLLDAIIECVPKLQTPSDRKLVLFIVTDGSAGGVPGTGYTHERAINVCRSAGAQVNAIAGIAPGGVFIDIDKFQRRITEATNGICYIMPGVGPSYRDWRNR